MAHAAIAGAARKISAICPPSQATAWMAATPSMRSRAMILFFRCPRVWMTCTPRRSSAPESSDFAACVWRASTPGDRVGLFGFGASAHLTIAVLHAWKCEVYVSTRGESHRQLASKLGAKWVGSETDRPPVELDRAVTFAPSGDVVIAALSSLRKGGIVAINAIHLDRMPQFDYDRLLWGERQIRSVANMTRVDAHDFLRIAARLESSRRQPYFRWNARTRHSQPSRMSRWTAPL